MQSQPHRHSFSPAPCRPSNPLSFDLRLGRADVAIAARRRGAVPAAGDASPHPHRSSWGRSLSLNREGGRTRRTAHPQVTILQVTPNTRSASPSSPLTHPPPAHRPPSAAQPCSGRKFMPRRISALSWVGRMHALRLRWPRTTLLVWPIPLPHQ